MVVGNIGAATAGNGSNDIDSVVGSDSSAFAGADSSAAGNFDLAAVFADGLSSTTATGGNFLVDILPTL